MIRVKHEEIRFLDKQVATNAYERFLEKDYETVEFTTDGNEFVIRYSWTSEKEPKNKKRKQK